MLLAGRIVPLTSEEIVTLSTFGLVQVKINKQKTVECVDERDTSREISVCRETPKKAPKRDRIDDDARSVVSAEESAEEE